MRRICFIETTWPHNSRTARFKQSFNERGDDIFSIGWDRLSSYKLFKDNEFVKQSKIGYGKPYLKILNLFSFFVFTVITLRKVKPEIIFLSHWDSLLVGIVARFLIRSQCRIVYDCLDMPTSGNKIILICLQKLDRFMAAKCHIVIFASRFFECFYTAVDKSQRVVFENYPSKKIVNSEVEFNLSDDTVTKLINNKIISWIGVVRYFDVLKNLLDALSGLKDYHLFVFGDGPDLEKMKHYCERKDLIGRVTFFGRYDFESISNIYSISDFVWAAYPSKDFNVKYAISNKYFECNLFRKVPIFSKNTKLCELVNEKVGSAIFVDEYSSADIKDSILKYSTAVFFRYEEVIYWEQQIYKVVEHRELF